MKRRKIKFVPDISLAISQLVDLRSVELIIKESSEQITPEQYKVLLELYNKQIREMDHEEIINMVYDKGLDLAVYEAVEEYEPEEKIC